jgi:hypothetical protein
MSQKSVPNKTFPPRLVRVYQHPYERMVQELEDQGLEFNAGETWEEELARLQAEAREEAQRQAALKPDQPRRVVG